MSNPSLRSQPFSFRGRLINSQPVLGRMQLRSISTSNYYLWDFERGVEAS